MGNHSIERQNQISIQVQYYFILVHAITQCLVYACSESWNWIFLRVKIYLLGYGRFFLLALGKKFALYRFSQRFFLLSHNNNQIDFYHGFHRCLRILIWSEVSYEIFTQQFNFHCLIFFPFSFFCVIKVQHTTTKIESGSDHNICESVLSRLFVRLPQSVNIESRKKLPEKNQQKNAALLLCSSVPLTFHFFHDKYISIVKWNICWCWREKKPAWKSNDAFEVNYLMRNAFKFNETAQHRWQNSHIFYCSSK